MNELINEESISNAEDTKSDATERELPDTEASLPIDSTSDEADTKEVSDGENEVDYERIIEDDLAELRAEFPELYGISDITELDNPLRYAALRDLGLSATEAYLATTKRKRHDNRAHLKSAYGRSAAAPTGMMTQRELRDAREIFGNLSDAEIQRLYRKVTS